MKDLLKSVSILLLLLVQFTNAEDGTSLSIRASKIWNEIDTLEKQKPLVRAVISYCQTQQPIVSKMKKDVEVYAKKVEIAYKSNAIKTIISGSLSLAGETAGGISGKSLVDLGVWLTSKGISIAMGDSNTFGGVSSYKRKINGFLQLNNRLTKELNKLTVVSQTSNEAIQSYYAKYGKYSDLFGKLGDVGVFTTRMRLIIEQSAPAIASLEVLESKLFSELEAEKLHLKNIDEEIRSLKKELKEVQNQKSIKTEPFKPILTDKDKNKGKVVGLSANVAIRGISGCEGASSQLAYLDGKLKSIYDALKPKVDELRSLRKAYYEKVTNKIVEARKKSLDILHSADFPTGYEVPLNKLLEVQDRWNQAHLKSYRELILSLEKIVPTVVTDLPDEKLEKEVYQLILNHKKVASSYFQLRFGTCFQDRHGSYTFTFTALDQYIISGAQLPKDKYYFRLPSRDNYVERIKSTKRDLLVEIAKTKKNLKSAQPYYRKMIDKLRQRNIKKRELMQQSIASYEKAVKRSMQYDNDLMVDIQRLQNLYSSALFNVSEKNFVKQYSLKFDIDDTKSICEIIKDIKNRLNSPIIQNIISLERKIQISKSMLSLYSFPQLPKGAFIEFGKDIDDTNKRLAVHNENFKNSLLALEHMNSDALAMYNIFSSSSFHKSSKFSTLYRKLIHESKAVKSLVLGLRSEISSALSRNRIPHDTYKRLSKYYDSVIDRYKKTFYCLPLNYPLLEEIVENLSEIKELLSKLRGKATYKNIDFILKDINALHEEIKGLYVSESNEYKNTYNRIKTKYDKYYKTINYTNKDTINPTDRSKANEILLKIKTLLGTHEGNIESFANTDNIGDIEKLYLQFAQYYSNKNIASLLSLISDDWQSSSDGTTLMDLEDTLTNSFSIFDEVVCEINSLNIVKVSKNTYQVNYVILIKGFIYDEDIEHVEKSSVVERVTFIDDIPKITTTLSGKYWKIR